MIYTYSLMMTDAPEFTNILRTQQRNRISVDWFCPSCVMVVWLLGLRTGRVNADKSISIQIADNEARMLRIK